MCSTYYLRFMNKIIFFLEKYVGKHIKIAIFTYSSIFGTYPICAIEVTS